MKALDTKIKSTVKLPETLSENAAVNFMTKVNSLLSEKPSRLMIDCSDLAHVFSNHIGLLWWACQSGQEAGIQVCLESPSYGLIRVLQALDIHDLFCYDAAPLHEHLNRIAEPVLGNNYESYACRFNADPEGVKDGLEKFLEFLHSLQLPPITEFELRTIFYEIATNISNHAELQEVDRISFSARADNAGIVLVFEDSGKPFDPTQSDFKIDLRAAARQRQLHGFGILMVGKLADELSYVRKDNSVNIFTVEKRWGQNSG